MVFTLLQEDRFACADRLIDTIRPAHFSRSREYGEDVREGRGMPPEPTARFESKDRRLDERPSFEGLSVSGAIVTPSSTSPRGTNAASGAKLNRSTTSSLID